jgi:Na+-driven multidrug efflux pump
MGAEGEVLQLVVAYAEVWVVFGLVSFTVPMVSSTVLRALGIAKVPGYIMTVTSGVQLVVSPILIFGLFGVPAQGLLGSAYGFLIIGFIRIIAFSILVANEHILQTTEVFKGWLQSARAIMHIALPSMLSSLIGPISMGITIALLAAHGDVIVAAFGVVSRIEMLVTMILGALASSVAPFVGQNWGAKHDDRVREGLSIAYRFCLFWGVLCFIVINDDEQLIEASGWFLVIVPISFGLMGVGQVAASVFIALGKPMPPTILSILRTVVVYIPMALVFDMYWGYVGIFISLMVANVLFGGAAYAWERIMLRKELLLRA